MVFFQKNCDIWNLEFQQNSIICHFFFIFLAFLAFFFLFHLSKLVQKLWNILQCFIGRVRDFTNDFWKILKVLLKKYWYMKYFLLQNLAVYYLFFYFLLFLKFYFQYRLSVLAKKYQKFLCFFLFYGLEIVSKNFEKSWNIFLKNIDIWNPKFVINSIIYYFF